MNETAFAKAHPKFVKRFWKRVSKSDTCWRFTGRSTQGPKHDYGVCFIPRTKPRRATTAHRMMWMIVNGPIEDGMYICHKCDNPICVNPDHLFKGTPKDNTRDSMAKGRFLVGGQRKGVPKLKLRKLTEAQIKQIRNDYVPYRNSFPKLAIQYGVSAATITMIIKRYRHYKDR